MSNKPGSVKWIRELRLRACATEASMMAWAEDEIALYQQLEDFDEDEVQRMLIVVTPYRNPWGVIDALLRGGRLDDRTLNEILEGNLFLLEAMSTEVLRDQVLALLPTDDALQMVRVPVQVAYTRDVTATTGRLYTGRPGVTVDVAMALWSELLAKSAYLVLAGPRELFEDAEAALLAALLYAENRDLQHLLVGFSLIGEVGAKDAEEHARIVGLEKGIQRFVVAHEYGHVLLGHLASEHPSEAERKTMEYEADDYCERAMRFSGQTLSILPGVNLLMRALALVEPEATVSHPSWGDRWARLRQRLLRHTPEAVDYSPFDRWFDFRDAEYLRRLRAHDALGG